MYIGNLVGHTTATIILIVVFDMKLHISLKTVQLHANVLFNAML